MDNNDDNDSHFNNGNNEITEDNINNNGHNYINNYIDSGNYDNPFIGN